MSQAMLPPTSVFNFQLTVRGEAVGRRASLKIALEKIFGAETPFQIQGDK